MIYSIFVPHSLQNFVSAATVAPHPGHSLSGKLIGLPHSLQNFASGDTLAPQLGHEDVNGEPQLLQNFVSLLFADLQLGHSTSLALATSPVKEFIIMV